MAPLDPPDGLGTPQARDPAPCGRAALRAAPARPLRHSWAASGSGPLRDPAPAATQLRQGACLRGSRASKTTQATGAVRTARRHHRGMDDGTRQEALVRQQLSEEFRVCVHCEHKGPLPTGTAVVPRPEPMPGYRILRCLAILGWSERELARRTGRHQTSIRRWIDGTAATDADVAEWLQLLAQFHRDHPAPRLSPLLRPPA